MIFLQNLWVLFVDMSFYIVIGLLLTGALNAFVDKDFILRQVGKKSVGSVVKASVFGVPLPLCSCGVLPTALYLGKNGASKGAVVSFLTSTPQTGVDSIIATYGFMGPMFAAYRAVAAFLSGIFAGLATNVLCKNDKADYTHTASTCGCSAEKSDAPTCGCGTEEKSAVACSCEAGESTAETSCCCNEAKPAETSSCCSSQDTAQKVEEPETSCCCNEAKPAETSSCCSSEPKVKESSGSCCSETIGATPQKTSFVQKIKSIFTFAFGSFLDDIASHFVVGLVIAALISTLVPEEWLSSITNPFFSMLIMLIIGIPMYICSTASIPIALSLMMKGVSPGAAFVFLFAGPVTNIASLTVLSKALGKKVLAIYLGSVAVCAIAFGYLLDYIIDTFNYSGISDTIAHTHEHGTPIYMTAVALVFGFFLLKSLFKKYVKKA